MEINLVSVAPQKALKHLTVVIIDFLLVLVMLFSGINCALNARNSNTENDTNGSNTNISVDVNISKNDQTGETEFLNSNTSSEETETNIVEETSFKETESNN